MANIIKLEDLTAHSAGLALSGASSSADAALIAEGWERRFTADLERVAEAIALYTQLGFEVRVEPVPLPDASSECQPCHSASARQFKTIYTHKKKD